MKHRIPIATQGWLPQDPYIPSHLKIVSNKHRWISKAKIVTGSTLLLIGLIAFSMALMAMQRTNEIYDKSLVINANERNSPMYLGGGYGTASSYDKPPTQEGKITVNGGSVEFTVISTEQITKTFYNNGRLVNCTVNSPDPNDRHQIISTTVEGSYTFSIPANGYYEFIFQNLGSQQATVDFNLKTTWTFMIPLIIGLGILLVTALPGTLLLVSGRKSKKATFRSCYSQN
ncbi:MAG: emp24/gp25L/p24 family protein [Candidatus Bathyarchaeia archaeon]|jgi:hypothetical protein